MATNSKKDRLGRSATASVRTPTPERAAHDQVRKKGYRVVAVSLYDPEAEWIDHATTALRQAGTRKLTDPLWSAKQCSGFRRKSGTRVPSSSFKTSRNARPSAPRQLGYKDLLS